jgi:GT2 family glycosyltransferase
MPERAQLDWRGAKAKVTVIICAYSLERLERIRAAINSVIIQRPQPAQVVLAVDHNRELASIIQSEFPMITVLQSDGPAGLSGTRNSGLKAATEPIAVFLDDDAEARAGWLAALLEPYRHPDVVATGGSVHPRWAAGRPGWFPEEFDWVVGCSYRGMPDSIAVIRNPIGANMSVRTRLALEIGGFDSAIGRVGTKPGGCEETELAIRLTASNPGSRIMYVPGAAVDHHVGRERHRPSYFISRCWHEGLSKAAVARLVGSSQGLASERRHVARRIPGGLWREMKSLSMGHPLASLRMAAIIGGLGSAGLGYILGHVRLAGGQRLRAVGSGADVEVDAERAAVDVVE